MKREFKNGDTVTIVRGAAPDNRIGDVGVVRRGDGGLFKVCVEGRGQSENWQTKDDVKHVPELEHGQMVEVTEMTLKQLEDAHGYTNLKIVKE